MEGGRQLCKLLADGLPQPRPLLRPYLARHLNASPCNERDERKLSIYLYMRKYISTSILMSLRGRAEALKCLPFTNTTPSSLLH